MTHIAPRPTARSMIVANRENLPIEDGTLHYYADFLESAIANDYFFELQRSIEWRQPVVQLFGKSISSPRLSAWYADEGIDYSYSGYEEKFKPWLPTLLEIKEKIEALLGHPFNGVLANLYRNGADSVGWHSDDERELGPNPVIASVSLGAQRLFLMRHKKKNKRESIRFELAHGSLLVMAEETQHHWRHSLPKTRSAVGPRINLTYRYLVNRQS